MTKWKKKVKHWHDRHCQVKRKHARHTIHRKDGNQIKKEKAFIAPQVFSIIDNTEETIAFLTGILNEIKLQRLGQKFYIDCSMVERVTIDALMYIIAIVYNIKTNAKMRYEFRGNLPKNREARRVFTDSGYLKFFESARIELTDRTDNIQIRTGKKNEPLIAKEICAFTKSIFGHNYDTIFIYNIMIELMGNTFSHAYVENHLLSPRWYFYAEADSNATTIEFTFIDVGEGIPTTMNKRLFENHIKSDGELIMSALKGGNRSSTKLVNRGLGLPYLLKECEDNKFDKFSVLSGFGHCFWDNESGSMQMCSTRNKVLGTVFTWKIVKEECKND